METTMDLDDDGEVFAQSGRDQLDPSSISLFSGTVPEEGGNDEATGKVETACDASSGEMKSQTSGAATGPQTSAAKMEPGQKAHEKPRKIFNTYQSGKGAEVAKRRNLQERLEKVRGESGIIFNVPQFKEVSMNQLAMFLRKFGKSTESQKLLSAELRAKIFPEDAAAIMAKANASSQQQTTSSNNQQHHVICVNDILGTDDDHLRQRDDEDELTEESADDDGEEWLLSGETAESRASGDEEDQPAGVSREQYDFYRQRMQILAADQRALAQIKRINEQQQRVRAALNSMPPFAEFQFMPPNRVGGGEQNSMTCARCRPLVSRPQRKLVRVNHDGVRRQPTRVASNMACGAMDYSSVDNSIHAGLSLLSAIPMERKAHKYLQVIGVIPAEVEERRKRIALLAYRKGDRMQRCFYNTTGAQIVEKSSRAGAAESLSITIRKTAKSVKNKQQVVEKRTRDERAERTRPSRTNSASSSDSDSYADDESSRSGDSSSYASASTTTRKRKRKDKPMSRRESIVLQQPEIKVGVVGVGVRPLHPTPHCTSSVVQRPILHCHQFGSAQYNLEMPAEEVDTKKTVSQEIPLPPYLKVELGMAGSDLSADSTTCGYDPDCPRVNEECWKYIREGHAGLEVEEKRRNVALINAQHGRGHHHRSGASTAP